MRLVKYAVVAWLLAAASAGAEPPIIPLDAGLPVIEWKEAGKYVDKPVIVQGKIVQTKSIETMCFLNFDTARSFTAVVPKECFKRFPKPPETMYDQKLVRIRGYIGEYNDKPQIELCSPDQVTILEQDQPIPPKPEVKPRAFNGTVTIATYNVMNLYDEYDDPYAGDEGTAPKPKEELEHLAASIRALDADVLALEEVENRGFLERFVTAFLGDMGYQDVVCFDSNDRRGIDCAVLSRLPVGPVTSYRHVRFGDGSKDSPANLYFRRDLLQVRIEPPDCPPFYVFAVHFKSKRDGGKSTEDYRLAETTQARKVLDGLLNQDKDALLVICGDFNDTFDSASVKALRGGGAGALRDFLSDLPKGTITYNREPTKSMIDFILVSPAMGQRYVAKSYRVEPGSIESTGSDHNPVVAKFNLKAKAAD